MLGLGLVLLCWGRAGWLGRTGLVGLVVLVLDGRIGWVGFAELAGLVGLVELDLLCWLVTPGATYSFICQVIFVTTMVEVGVFNM